MITKTKKRAAPRKKKVKPPPEPRVKRKLVTVTRDEIKGTAVQVGPPKLTRFEKARIIGTRALQLSYGAPPFVPLPNTVRDPITIASMELESGALPISIRRLLPDGRHQNIAIKMLLG
ncbi:MAG: DNA-directed RNA polymerase subunit K [Thaumarchaeota archaeon]|nr:DNA-directed RNA polymerase subunit K [Nitrososphaerota archaeon]